MNKPKKCKGINIAKSFNGCGKETFYRKFGLCNLCLSEWLDTEAGRIYFKKQLLPKTKQIIQKKEKQETLIKKKKLLSNDKFRSQYIQPVINEIARLIDYGNPCIATGNYGKMNGGHYHSVGSNRTISMNLHNIHIQSFESNHYKGGDNVRYRIGLEQVYGKEYLEFIENLKQHIPLKLKRFELENILSKAKEIRESLRKEPKKLTPKERIDLRNLVNQNLGIYLNSFSIFKN